MCSEPYTVCTDGAAAGLTCQECGGQSDDDTLQECCPNATGCACRAGNFICPGGRCARHVWDFESGRSMGFVAEAATSVAATTTALTHGGSTALYLRLAPGQTFPPQGGTLLVSNSVCKGGTFAGSGTTLSGWFYLSDSLSFTGQVTLFARNASTSFSQAVVSPTPGAWTFVEVALPGDTSIDSFTEFGVQVTAVRPDGLNPIPGVSGTIVVLDDFRWQ
jgi:hypothetical protein